MAPTDGWRPFCRLFFLIGVCLCIAFVLPPKLLANSGFSYNISIEGSPNRELKRLLEAVSQTAALRERPPASLKLLRKRIDLDIPRLLKALKSQGFYGARVASEIHEDVEPIQVFFRIEAGLPYLLKSVDIRISFEGDLLEEKPPEPSEIGLVLGEPVQSKRILDAGKEIRQWLRKRGFPFPSIANPKVVVDHAERSVSVEFHGQPGPRALFGLTEIQGLESVNEGYARSKIAWKQGDRFNADLLQETEGRLTATGLFATAQVSAGQAIDQEGRLPMVIQVKERKHRTIKAGMNYKTDEGPGGKLAWEHRNLLSRGERLTLEGTASGITYAAEGSFDKPDFLRSNQALLLTVQLAEEHPDAFTSKKIESIVKIERMFSKEFGLGVGLGFRFSDVKQFGQEDRFSLYSLPMELDWDTSDKPLDPRKGGRLNLQLIPYRDFSGTDLTFIKGYGHYTHYIQLLQRPLLVSAMRVTLGATGMAEREEIPADLRLYAGGGGSVRGYAYQSVGPLLNGRPIGGRSLAGLSWELRMKVTETVGFTLFLDGGNVFESNFPNFEQSLLWGTGAGFRYFTPVGPVRLDVGIPLNRREGIDDSFQIYVSLGQAF